MEVILGIIIIIFSAILHEIMHGFVANKLGDPTARLMGRLTLNPIPHIDPVMSVLFPAALYFLSGGQVIFAAAKPVPINPMHFKDPRRDMALTALAGPLTNFSIAIVFTLLFTLFVGGDKQPAMLQILGRGFQMTNPFEIVIFILGYGVYINLFLGFLNLIPIPPLDGSRVFSILLPSDLARTYMSIERYGIFILFFLLTFPIAGFSIGDIINGLVLRGMQVLGF